MRGSLRPITWIAPIAALACGSSQASPGADAAADSEAPLDSGTLDARDSAVTDAGAGDALDAASVTAAIVAFCNASFGAFFSDLQGCCSAADMQSSYYGLVTGLVAQGQQFCGQQIPASVLAGRATFDPTAVAACEQQFQKTYSGKCWPELVTNHASTGGTFATSACRNVVTGLQHAGQPCTNDYECVDGLACVGETTTNDGACQAPGALGATCGEGNCAGNCPTDWGFGNHPACVAGAYCFGTCQALAMPGQSCLGEDSCVSGYVCVATGPQASCKTSYSPQGTECQQTQDCLDGLYCDTSVEAGGYGYCEPKGAAGATCTDGHGCNGYCDLPDGGGAGTCVALCGSG